VRQLAGEANVILNGARAIGHADFMEANLALIFQEN
jgi:hypothetical protein